MRPLIRLLFAIGLALLSAAAIATHSEAFAAPDGSNPRKKVLVVGDSLAAEYGIARGKGWVPLLGRRLADNHPGYEVVNASISGDTTSGGLARLAPLLQHHRPAIVVLELGANDALRGLPLSMTQKNLTAMAKQARRAGARVLIVGMRIPPNYGRAYTDQFRDLFAKVAKEEDAGLVPFLMQGMATDRSLFQADGIHPNETAQPMLLDNVWAGLQPLLD